MNKHWTILLEIALLLGLCAWLGYTMADRTPPPAGMITEVKLPLPGPRDRAWLVQRDGRYLYVITSSRGEKARYTPEEFAAYVQRAHTERPWWASVLNINTRFGILWVTLGLLGQVLFTGRMVVQWLVSEKHQRSVVPPAFWWMSLIGATMLLMYFLWRKDPVGVLGQAFGWFIYVKNLWLIYRAPQPEPEPAAAAAPSGPVAKPS